MYFSEIITLRMVIDAEQDEDGYQASSEYSDTQVWANRVSVARTEFYSAHSAGIKADIIFQVHTEDYGNQKIILYNGNQYSVIRAYQKGEGIAELTCSDKAV